MNMTSQQSVLKSWHLLVILVFTIEFHDRWLFKTFCDFFFKNEPLPLMKLDLFLSDVDVYLCLNR